MKYLKLAIIAASATFLAASCCPNPAPVYQPAPVVMPAK